MRRKQRDGAVLGDDGIDRPAGGEGLTPAHRPPGDGHDPQAGGLQRAQRGQCIGGNGAFSGQRVVNVGENAGDAAALFQTPVIQLLHGEIFACLYNTAFLRSVASHTMWTRLRTHICNHAHPHVLSSRVND